MNHITWLDESNIQVVRVNSRKYDTFLGDIIEKVSINKPRLILYKKTYYVRYKKGRKINGFRVFIHKVSSIYYLTPDEIVNQREKNRLDVAYRKFNRGYYIKKIIG